MEQGGCPHCGAKIIEDVWEILEEREDGVIIQDIIYPALVCSKFCGFFERAGEDYGDSKD